MQYNLIIIGSGSVGAAAGYYVRAVPDSMF